ncbi:MAG: DUF2335 domain-containing protein [Spirochaetes bacterium]|nr:MAG: DUF2335 domain-containing protein [Spirochaetota bacterium]
MINKRKKRKLNNDDAKLPEIVTPIRTEGSNLRQQEQVVGVSREEMWCAPLPHPSAFAKYEQILPGSADRIIALTENEQKFRHDFNLEMMRSDRGLKKLGLILAFSIIIVLLVSTVILYLISNSEWIAISLIGEIALIASLFIYWTRKNKKDSIVSQNKQMERLSDNIESLKNNFERLLK